MHTCMCVRVWACAFVHANITASCTYKFSKTMKYDVPIIIKAIAEQHVSLNGNSMHCFAPY